MTRLLGQALSGRHADELADHLLNHFGSLTALATAPAQALLHIEGVGPARARQLTAIFALARAWAREGAEDGAVVDSCEAAWKQLEALSFEQHEQLWGLYLDARLRLICRRVLTTGSRRHTIVDPGVVFSPAVMVGATAVIVAHNHPSGALEASLEDCRVTERLSEAGRVLGISLLDHLIVARGRYCSMASAGLLPEATSSCPWNRTA